MIQKAESFQRNIAELEKQLSSKNAGVMCSSFKPPPLVIMVTCAECVSDSALVITRLNTRGHCHPDAHFSIKLPGWKR